MYSPFFYLLYCRTLSKPTSAGRSSDNDVGRNQHKSEETVTISKDYLERLLRQNLIKDSDTVSSSQNDKSEVTPTHVLIEHDQIPGLGHQTNTNRPKGVSTVHNYVWALKFAVS